ncbi:hypothetical protein EWB00_002453 [Schistosoma japonicum]|uniref:Uncharacterized protein n=1 Tax=Schistosoma japonicum TaxID=6182 RepID=A0A4Z2DCL9_SCHJA|nr:hypothetical protein EWB00_002453 [Schistosoma japonicum]
MSQTPAMKSPDKINSNDVCEVSNLDLFLEFTNCVMSKDFRQAINLAKQILEFEPNNSRIQEFLPLLNEADYMKTADSEQIDDSDSYTNTSTDTDSSDEFDYTSSDSDRHHGRKKLHGT